jgi:c-di-AMP phosphodiesterase-like protein
MKLNLKSLLKYIPILLIGIAVIIVIGFIIKNILTIIAGIVIILIVYFFIKNQSFRNKIMSFLSNIFKKVHDSDDKESNV